MKKLARAAKRGESSSSHRHVPVEHHHQIQPKLSEEEVESQIRESAKFDVLFECLPKDGVLFSLPIQSSKKINFFPSEANSIGPPEDILRGELEEITDLFVTSVLSASIPLEKTSGLVGPPTVTTNESSDLSVKLSATETPLEWLKVQFPFPCWAKRFHLYETVNPGSLVRIHAYLPEIEKETVVYSKKKPDHSPNRYRKLVISLEKKIFSDTFVFFFDVKTFPRSYELNAIEMISSSPNTEFIFDIPPIRPPVKETVGGFSLDSIESKAELNDFTLVFDEITSISQIFANYVQHPELLIQINQLLKEDRGAEASALVPFELRKEKISLNSCVLALYFPQISLLAEAQQLPIGSEIYLPDIPAETFRIVLNFVYREEVGPYISALDCIRVAAVADYFQLHTLAEIAQSMIKDRVNDRNITLLLDYAFREDPSLAFSLVPLIPNFLHLVHQSSFDSISVKARTKFLSYLKEPTK